MIVVLIFISGLVIGSFISALTWRLPRNSDFVNDRSRCDKCGKVLEWVDNIPLLSYLMLKGKCKRCHKKISLRYPLIEMATALSFSLAYLHSANMAPFQILIALVLSAIFISIFVFDFEHQVIPDELVFLGILFVIFNIVSYNTEGIFTLFVSGFGASLFLLLINILTKGKGMGFGDVKFAILGGLILGYPNTIAWMFLSFVLGALVGIFLLIVGKTEFGKRIAFGPFLVIGLFISWFWGHAISSTLFPYLK